MTVQEAHDEMQQSWNEVATESQRAATLLNPGFESGVTDITKAQKLAKLRFEELPADVSSRMVTSYFNANR